MRTSCYLVTGGYGCAATYPTSVIARGDSLGGVGGGGEDDKERIISYFLLESVDTAGSSIRSSSFLLCSFSLSESSFDILM